MNRAIKLFLAGFLSLVLLTSLAVMVFDNDDPESSGPVTQMEIYHSDNIKLEDIDPNN